MRVPSNTGLRGEVGLTRIEENFYPALGFVRRTGIDQADLDSGTLAAARAARFAPCSRASIATRIEYLDDGSIQSQNVTLQALNLELNSQDAFGINVSNNKEGLRTPFMISQGVTIPEGEYSFDNVNLQLRSGDQRALRRRIVHQRRRLLRRRALRRHDLRRLAEPAFSRQPELPIQRDSFPGKGDDLLANGLPRCTTLDCAFITRVVRLSLEAIFSSRLSWVNLIQYDNVSQTVGVNSRLHWIPQAGREAFLVLNHNRPDDPLTPDDDFHSSFAEVTLKYSYTFRF